MDSPSPTPRRPLDYAAPPNHPRRTRPWVLLLLLIPGLALMAWQVQPRLITVRGVSNRVKCQSNLRQIGQGILLYTMDHGGDYPDSFATLLLNEDLTADVFVCPSSSDTPATGPTTQTAAANLLAGGHCSFIYLGSGWKTVSVPANAVVACEPLANHANDGSNVLFGDGHVEFMDAKWMARLATKLASRPHASTMPVTLPSQ